MLRPERLVLVGSVLADVLLYLSRFPERGGDVLASEGRLTTGGGFNVLVGARRLGLAVGFAGRVGEGAVGDLVAADLAAAGIPSLLPRASGEDTGFTVGLAEAGGENTFVTAPGAESRLSPEDLDALPLEPGDAVYVSGYDLAYPVSGGSLAGWLPTLEPGHLLVIDPGPLASEIPPERLDAALRRTDVLSLNTREATLLTGAAAVAESADLLARRLPEGARVVVRDGRRGCWAAGGGTPSVRLPALPARRVVDATGAGDAHVASLLARLARGDAFEEAARIANVAASLAVGRRGPATGPTTEELEAVLGRGPSA